MHYLEWKKEHNKLLKEQEPGKGIVYYVSQIHHVVKMLTLSPASEKSS